jgi:hypothetical protein
MLFETGYDILSFDLRNHGLSFRTPNLMATFGHTEHLDVLGAIDYLFDNNITNTVGVFGASMGGATSLIASAHDERIKATFVDSPICDGEDLVRHHITSIFGSYLSKLMFSIIKWFAINWSGEFPPFENNPITSMKHLSGRPVHFEHTERDVIVPLSHSHKCSKLGQDFQANVTTWFAPSHSKISPSLFNNCWDHCVNILSDPIAYKQRLKIFFTKYIKP